MRMYDAALFGIAKEGRLLYNKKDDMTYEH